MDNKSKSVDTPVSGTLEGEVRTCPFCRDHVHPHATRCRHCGEFLREGIADATTREMDYEKHRLVVDMKEEMSAWVRSKFVSTGVISLVITGLMGVGAHFYLDRLITDVVAESVKARVDERVETEVTTKLAEERNAAQQKVQALIEESSVKLEGMQTELTLGADRLKVINAAAGRSVEGFTDLEERFETALKRMSIQAGAQREFLSSLRARTPWTQSLPGWGTASVNLVEPISVSPARLRTLYRGATDTQVFEWRFHPPTPDPYEFALQWSGTEEFNAEEVHEIKTGFLTLDVDLSTSAHRVFWRVQAKNLTSGETLGWSETGQFEVFDSAFQRIQKTGEIRIGTSYTQAGKFGHDQPASADGGHRLTGFDIELGRVIVDRISNALGRDDDFGTESVQPLKPRFVLYDWGSLLRAPSLNQADLIIATITIREEREARFGLRFSEPYHTMYAGLIFPANARPAAGELNELVIVAQRHTTGLELAHKIAGSDGTLLPVETVAELCDAVLDGRAGVAITDLDVARSEVERRKLEPRLGVLRLDESYLGAQLVADKNIRPDEYGIAVAESEEFLFTLINESIDQVLLDRLREAYLK